MATGRTHREFTDTGVEMKVLVTGGAGYIGLELCRQLLERGHSVRVVDRLFFGVRPLEQLQSRSGGRLEIIHADVRSFEDRWLDDVDGISHLAGLSNDPTAEYNPDANWQMNVVATETIAKAAARRGIARFVFGSSASIYDGIGPGMFDENSTVDPRGAYSKSKHAAERLLLQMCSDAFAPTIFRQGTVYGYSLRMRFDLVVNTFVRDAITRGKLFLHGGGWQWRPLVDVSDVARAHTIVLEAPLSRVGGQIFNVMQENYQVRQLAMLVQGSLSLHGRQTELVDAPLPAIVRNYRASSLKLTQSVGFTPSVTVLESIDDMLKRCPIDDARWLNDPRHLNIEWMSLLEEVHATHSRFISIY